MELWAAAVGIYQHVASAHASGLAGEMPKEVLIMAVTTVAALDAVPDDLRLPARPAPAGRPEQAEVRRYWSPARTDVMRWVLKPSQCMRPT